MNLFILPTNTCFGIGTPIDDIKWYNSIYEIKSRDFSKPLAILVEDFKWLEKNTKLNNSQIDFLKNYKNPFTILTHVKEDIINKNIKNKEIYKFCAFRVAHDDIQLELTKKYWPLFLTSANKSWESEIFSTKKIKQVFESDIEKYDIEVFWGDDYDIKTEFSSSDIFEFIWDTNNIKYMRKN